MVLFEPYVLGVSGSTVTDIVCGPVVCVDVRGLFLCLQDDTTR